MEAEEEETRGNGNEESNYLHTINGKKLKKNSE